MRMTRPLRTASLGLSTAVLAIGMTVGATSASASVRPNALSPKCAIASGEPQIGYGSSGPIVEQAQCELNYAWAYGLDGSIPVDGQFGPTTKGATQAFQECAGLTPDGIIGPQTWAALDYWVNTPYSCT